MLNDNKLPILEPVYNKTQDRELLNYIKLKNFRLGFESVDREL